MRHSDTSGPARLGWSRSWRVGRWHISVATFAIVLLSCVLAAASLSSILRLRADAGWVAHTDEVLTSLAQALLLTVDAETAERGFVLTGDPAYLQPYRDATRGSLLELDRLGRLVADSPAQSGRHGQLRLLIQRRLDVIDRIIDQQIAKGPEAARTIIASGEGKRLQDEIRAAVARMRDVETALLAERQANSERSATLAMLAIGISAAAAVVLAVMASAHLERRNAELARASAAKSEFIASMSHEVRTPMNAIVGLTQLLVREPLTADQQKMLQGIATAGRSLMAILNDILDLSKIEAGQLRINERSFTLGPLLMHLDSLFGPSASCKGVALRFELPTAPTLSSMLLGDRDRLEQVLVNLVGNALKFTEHGEIVVRSRLLTQGAGQVRLRFEVQDTGMGIADDEVHRLFQPFVQGGRGQDGRSGGTGLGLSISKRLVELMGGSIGVLSTLGAGSTFWFELPFATGQGSEAPQPVYGMPPLAAPAPRLSGLHLLVVDDNETNLELVERALRLEGASATAARDGQQAVQALRAQPAAYAGVPMDLQMPRLDGIAATRVVREQLGLQTLPVVIFSASVLPEDRDRALAAGVTDFLAKPVDIEELVAVLRRYAGPSSPASPQAVAATAEALPATPPEASAGAVQAWPEIDGIESTAVRRMLRGDLARLLRLAATLLQQASSVSDEVVRGRAEGGPREDAQRALHTLRGAASTLGALQLAQSTLSLEAALRERTDGTAALATFEAERLRLAMALGPWCSAATGGPVEAPKTGQGARS